MKRLRRESAIELNSLGDYRVAVATFGENIRRIRKAKGMKAYELAAAVQVKPSVVSGWENDRTGLPETPTLFKLAKALNCTFDDLLDGVDPEYSARGKENADKIQALVTRALMTVDDVSGGRFDRFTVDQLSRLHALDLETLRRHLSQLQQWLDGEMGEDEEFEAEDQLSAIMAIQAAMRGMAPEAYLKIVQNEADPLDEDVTNYRREDIPIIQEGEASPSGLTWDVGDPSINESERTSRPYDFRETGAYAIVLNGDSMEPILKRGMRLIMSVTKPIGDGDLVYAQLKNGQRMVKIATRITDGWLLTSANPAHPPRQVHRDEIEHIHKVAYVRFLK